MVATYFSKLANVTGNQMAFQLVDVAVLGARTTLRLMYSGHRAQFAVVLVVLRKKKS